MKKSSPRKIEANRQNAELSTGPKHTASSRYNARKHGLTAQGISELDEPEKFGELLSRLEMQFKPVGELETFLVNRIALGMVRVRRCAALEAQFLTARLNPQLTETIYNITPEDILLAEQLAGKTHILDPGIPCRVSSDTVEVLTNVLGRYETQAENRLWRSLHELERIQRARRGEVVPPPTAADVTVHAASPVASFGNRAVPVPSATTAEE